MSRYQRYPISQKSSHQINNAATAIDHEAQSIMLKDYIAGVTVILPARVLQ